MPVACGSVAPRGTLDTVRRWYENFNDRRIKSLIGDLDAAPVSGTTTISVAKEPADS